jgi:hypothetical protein
VTRAALGLLLSFALAAPAWGGHGENVDVPPATRRFAGTVTAVGAPDTKGDVLSFKVSVQEEAVPPLIAIRKADAIAKSEFVLAEVHSWRVTFVSGALLGNAYHVASNTATEVTVVDLYRHGPLNELKVGDRFFVEEIYFQRRD